MSPSGKRFVLFAKDMHVFSLSHIKQKSMKFCLRYHYLRINYLRTFQVAFDTHEKYSMGIFSCCSIPRNMSCHCPFLLYKNGRDNILIIDIYSIII